MNKMKKGLAAVAFVAITACTIAGNVSAVQYGDNVITDAQKYNVGTSLSYDVNTDGYFYSDHYTLNGHVAEVQDDDAIARAEAEYNIKKGKLDYKEQTLELKMKNIDTELSALTTEYDTVKNLISKNVEKVFTMFST